MKRILLALGLWLGLTTLASAQVPCIGVGGVLAVPQVGLACPQEPAVLSYVAVAQQLAVAATPTDIACIQGAANIVIRLQQIKIAATISTQLVVPAYLIKRAALDTGGTPATGTALPVALPVDSGNAAAKASFNAWTANPTIGDTLAGLTEVGNVVFAKADGTNGTGVPYTLWDWSGTRYMQAPLLRTAAQALCINLNSNAGTFTGNKVDISFRWTEAAQ